MANEYYTRTNQKIYFAGLLLDTWKQAEEGRAATAQAQVMALREAVLFHLYGAVLALGHEIAGYYRTGGLEQIRVESLLEQQRQQQAPSPEFTELLELAAQPASWLARLLEAHAALFAAPVPVDSARLPAPSDGLIATVSVDEPVVPLAQAELQHWRQQLKELALRFRESLTEC